MNKTQEYIAMMDRLINAPIIRTDRTISKSIWTMHHQRTKKNLDVYDVEVIVVGNDLEKMANNNIFVQRAYKAVFKKDNWRKEYAKGSLKVANIKLGRTHGESFAPETDEIMQ